MVEKRTPIVGQRKQYLECMRESGFNKEECEKRYINIKSLQDVRGRSFTSQPVYLWGATSLRDYEEIKRGFEYNINRNVEHVSKTLNFKKGSKVKLKLVFGKSTPGPFLRKVPSWNKLGIHIVRSGSLYILNFRYFGLSLQFDLF